MPIAFSRTAQPNNFTQNAARSWVLSNTPASAVPFPCLFRTGQLLSAFWRSTGSRPSMSEVDRMSVCRENRRTDILYIHMYRDSSDYSQMDEQSSQTIKHPRLRHSEGLKHWRKNRCPGKPGVACSKVTEQQNRAGVQYRPGDNQMCSVERRLLKTGWILISLMPRNQEAGGDKS